MRLRAPLVYFDYPRPTCECGDKQSHSSSCCSSSLVPGVPKANCWRSTDYLGHGRRLAAYGPLELHAWPWQLCYHDETQSHVGKTSGFGLDLTLLSTKVLSTKIPHWVKLKKLPQARGLRQLMLPACQRGTLLESGEIRRQQRRSSIN